MSKAYLVQSDQNDNWCHTVIDFEELPFNIHPSVIERPANTAFSLVDWLRTDFARAKRVYADVEASRATEESVHFLTLLLSFSENLPQPTEERDLLLLVLPVGSEGSVGERFKPKDALDLYSELIERINSTE
ncbi:hypothetical protein [Azospirillum doebereinerae]